MSFKSEFSDVYNYLSDCCKDPIFTAPEASEDDFRWKDDDVSTGVIIRYNGSAEVVKIPNGVVEIGSRDSSGYYDPEGGYGCFEGCEAITRIPLPKSLKIIGKYAFAGCTNLNKINIPNSVTSIGARAFQECMSLTSINIPNNVKSIGYAAFSHCYNLKSINISNSVISIGAAAFRESGLESIVLPNSVTSIGGLAFRDCKNLKSIVISDSVKSIGNGAFRDCKNLTSITCSFDLDLSIAEVPADCRIIRR